MRGNCRELEKEGLASWVSIPYKEFRLTLEKKLDKKMEVQELTKS